MCRIAVVFYSFPKVIHCTLLFIVVISIRLINIIFISCMDFDFNPFILAVFTFRWFIDMADITDFFDEVGQEFRSRDVEHIKYFLQDSLTGKLYGRFNSNFSRECSITL